jgi:very-short-patch-repair endonuclease
MTQHITRLLRKSMTPRERKLWNVLKNKQLKNIKFRKQFKIAKFVVDFCSLEYKLVIELDGGHHYTAEQHWLIR